MAGRSAISRPAGMSGGRLWLVDHLLRDDVGHHAGYNAALAAAAFRAGVNAKVVGHHDARRLDFPNAKLLGHFHTDWRNEPPRWMVRSRRLLDLLEALSGRRFFADLRRLPQDMKSEDLVFAQMIAPRHLMAWLRWLNGRSSKPVLVLHLGYQPWRFERADVKSLLSSLAESVQSRVRFATDSEKLVAPFESALGRRVHYLPHVVETAFPSAAPSRCKDSPVFLSAGNARREKGFSEILEALGLLSSRLAAGEFRVCVQTHQPDAFCAAILKGFAGLPSVSLMDECLATADYNATLAEADLILLPYHLDHYALRTSGVFCEARCAGRLVIATKGSWAGDRVEREGGGWVVSEKNPADLASGIARALGPERLAKAAEAAALQERSQKEFSPDAFLSRLLNLADESQ